jgi:hypothetical protein
MKKSVVVPLVMLASIATLTACTKPEMAPAPAPVTPVETVAPVTPEVTPVETPAAAETTTKVVQYQSPAGQEDVEFTVTVENGLITAVTSKTLATNDISKNLQNAFSSEVSAKVVGKSVSGFDVDVLGGASLTTAAFENFVQSL